ncbi:MAG: hypothetical protein AB4368_23910 [Xenococcaceae cyanobacterium]
MKLNATAHGLTSAAEFLVAATQELKHSNSDNNLVFAESSGGK